MNSYKFNQRFESSNKHTFYLLMHLSVLVIFFSPVFIIDTAHADLSTIPPQAAPKSHQRHNVPLPVSQKQTQINNIVVKARKAISKNILTTPASISALHYAKQLLVIFPEDNSALRILKEICNRYIALGNKRLKKYQIDLAQSYHDKAVKVARQFNVELDYKKLAKLQQEITITRQQIIQLRSGTKKQIVGRISIV